MKRAVMIALLAIGCGHDAAKAPPLNAPPVIDAAAAVKSAPDAAKAAPPTDAADPSASARTGDSVTNVCDAALVGDRCSGNGTTLRTHTDGSTTRCMWKRGVATCTDEPAPPP